MNQPFLIQFARSFMGRTFWYDVIKSEGDGRQWLTNYASRSTMYSHFRIILPDLTIEEYESYNGVLAAK